MKHLMAIIIALLTSATMTGCAGATGWRVSFGVAPIKSVNDMQGLEQQSVKPVRY